MYNFIRHFRDYLKLREAVKTAEQQYAKNPDRYYVIPSTDGKLLIMDRKNFRRLKRKHYISNNVTLNDLRRECFYYTPYANGTEAITPEERKERAEAYYAWCNFSRIGKKKRHGKR